MSLPGPAFMAPTLPAVGAALTLDVRESRHAGAARRLATGDRLRLVDGHGGVAEARIEVIAPGASSVTVRILSRAAELPPVPAVHLAAALPKGDRQAVMLDMAAQLGVRRVTPLDCRRAVVRPDRVKPERLHRLLVEACKQSGQSHVPALGAPAPPGAVAREAAAAGEVAVLLLADAPPLATLLAGAGSALAQRGVTLVVGPEGGFDDSERAAMGEAGICEASLTDTVLRVETAAVCAVALVRAAWRNAG